MATSSSGDKKSTIRYVVDFLSILTPILVAVGGWLINAKVSRIEKTVTYVEAMKPFMEMMTDSSEAKSKMAALAIYMLQKDDEPELAAKVILAPGQQHLIEVLKDLAIQNPEIQNELQRYVEKIGDVDSNLTTAQRGALEIIQDVNAKENESKEAMEAWVYLGDWKGKPADPNRISKKPTEGSKHKLNFDVNLRDIAPSKANNYRNGKIIGRALKGSEIEVLQVNEFNSGKVWALVSVEPH